tara:strand:- start:2811 stop:3602 length:792 start_codon:yes stop_codon:yes gene_type:complete
MATIEDRVRLSLIVPEVAVRTDDFRLAYRLLDRLRDSGIEHMQLDPEHPVPNRVDFWIASHAEVGGTKDARGIGCAIEEIDSVISSIMNRIAVGEKVQRICFGIDPGPRPGLSWIADGRPAGSIQMESVDATVDQVIAILNDFMPPESVVRIGNGSPTISSRIANVCLARGLSVQFVDETSTSIGSRHDHVSAARAICTKEGVPVTERLQVIPTEGEVREIQRRSRSISEGRLTIPSQLARAVAVGRLTLSEAVELHIQTLDR